MSGAAEVEKVECVLNLSVFVAIGFLGSLFTMFQFAKYCGRLNKGGRLDPETAEHYQNMAQRYLAATGTLLAVCILSIIVGIILS